MSQNNISTVEDLVGYSNESIWAPEIKNHFGNTNEIERKHE